MRAQVQWLTGALIGVFVAAGGATALSSVRAEIEIHPLSPREISAKALGAYARSTTGLPTVVVGYRAYLSALGVDTASHVFEHLAAVQWSVEAVPGGSVIPLGVLATTDTVSIVPDVEGSYQIGVVVTDDSSNVSDKALLWITAAYFVGVGNHNGQPVDVGKGQCALCHAANKAGWETTAHVGLIEEEAAGMTAGTGHYAERCIACHSVGWDTLYATGGLDLASGFVFPPVLTTTAYDSIVTNHPAQAQYFDIQCENCHGPGSLHKGATDKNQIAASYAAGVCGSCHDSGTHHVFPDQLAVSAHGSYADISGGGHASGSSCTRCHTAQGFVNETIGGGLAKVYEHPDPVTCAACHDPHDGTAPHALRRGSVAEACTGCHMLRLSSYSGIHHSHQGPMLLGEGGKELPGYEYPNSAHTAIAERCVECHMAATPSGVSWKVVGGHTFKVVGTDTTGVDREVLNDEGCKECHGGVGLEFVELTQAKTQKWLDSLNSLLPVYTANSGAFLAGDPKWSGSDLTPTERDAAFNWYFVANEGSYGVHNIAYTTALLRASISELWATRAAGSVVSVMDVPNDQGRMVRLLWNAFAAENAAVAPIVKYGVWRKNGDDWDFVGEVPAAKLSRYGLDVATLYDSTSAGKVVTTFKVSGHTTDPKVVYWSNALAGYSIDNLEPSTPAKLAYASGKLAWSPAPEPDVRYYAVFRTTLGGQLTDQVFATTVDTALAIERANFRYGVAAVDFAGNMSETAAIDVDFTNMRENRPAPTRTALMGNAPNPFNPSTRIQYQVHEPARITIVVYNVLGQPVRRLASGEAAVGVHTVTWDGLDENGLAVSSGAYLYVLTTDTGVRDVRRMLLVR